MRGFYWHYVIPLTPDENSFLRLILFFIKAFDFGCDFVFSFWPYVPIEQAIVCVVNKEFSARTVWACCLGEFRSGLIQYAKQWEPVGRSDWGVFLFGYFILDKQNKVTRQQGEVNN